MNPENISQHVDMRHSTLWRKSMWAPQDVSETPTCHRQMNQMAQTGRSWKSRDTFIQTNYSFLGRSSLGKSIRSNDLTYALHKDKKQSPLTKSLIDSIQNEADRLDRNKILVKKMHELKRMDLLTSKQLNHVKFPGIIKHQHIYNDYHGKTANPGYSRNHQGKFFTK